MQAYVFWHVPRAGVAARDYEVLHSGFHESLRQAPVEGFLGVRVFRLEMIPWLDPVASGYEDWHLLADSAALDRLNAAAVSSHRQLPHDRIAALAGAGTAGLYGLRLGTLITPTHAYWFGKPAGMSYADFERSLQPAVDAGCCLWGRRMTLGPTPEFCLHAPCEHSLPYAAHAMRLSQVLSHGADTLQAR